MAYTQEQINAALAAELEARPGTAYEDLLNYALATYGPNGLTENQVNAAYFDLSRDIGMDDAAFNEWANNAGWVEQDVLDARRDYLETPEGNAWLSSMQDPIQRDWAQTFWIGDMGGAQQVLDANKLKTGVLQDVYGISGDEIDAVANRYGVVPFGSTPPKKPPTNPTRQQQNYIQALRNNVGNIASSPYNYQRSNVGAADGKMMSAGTAPYASQLIQTLRQSSAQPFSTNRGIDLISTIGGPSQTNAINLQSAPSSGNLAFNPARLSNTSMPNGGAPADTPNTQGATQNGTGSVFAELGGEGGNGDGAIAGGGAMTTNQAMNSIALGSALSDYGSTMVAPGAFAAGLLGNSMMNAGQNALSSLDMAMLGISPETEGNGMAGGMTAGNSADIGPGYSF